ncbi:hypothetical protein QYM36_016281 [Artemia franciscana]|uniref:Uncharacterized protein n=1 Tax=Artemia franciscana TaxID=6661 RepID=A0AA88HC64_ARTSF|nr:hypothetical protein QYM36_016281 [Artemia franciscana]
MQVLQHPTIIQQFIQPQSLAMHYSIVQPMLMLRQPTILQTGIGPNGQQLYIIPSESQSQIIQSMMPFQHPNPVFQYLGTFPTSVLPTLNLQTQMATLQPANEIHPNMPVDVLQPDRTLFHTQCQQSAIQAKTLSQSELLFQNPKGPLIQSVFSSGESELFQPGCNVGNPRMPQVYSSETKKHV